MCANPLKTKAVSIGPAERAVNDHAGYPQDEGANALVQKRYSTWLTDRFFTLPHPIPVC